MIIHRHDDGTARLWDSSGLGLNILHKLKTQKLFDRRKTETQLDVSDTVFRITAITVNGNYLACAAQGGHVTLYRFNSKMSQNAADEELADIPVNKLN